MMGHVCRKLHPHSSLGSASVRTGCLDDSVISVFQVTGDTEEIHQENAEVSFPFYLSSLAVAIYFFRCCHLVLSLDATLFSTQIFSGPNPPQLPNSR